MLPIDKLAYHRAQMPDNSIGLLDARSIKKSHRRLTQILRPGMSVLDVGCATGAIARDIAEIVGSHGFVVGIDINPKLIARARYNHRNIHNLFFQVGDVYNLPFNKLFNIVTASRVIQWLSDPTSAIQSMVTVTKAEGCIIVLDYNYNKVTWHPNLPDSMKEFYNAFLCWRSEAGMDNAIADHLPRIFTANKLTNILITPQHDIIRRTDPNFNIRAGGWKEVIDSRGVQMTKEGIITETQRMAARLDYLRWVKNEAVSHTVYLLAVEGYKPK